MSRDSTIGLDIAKSVFQVHGVDGSGAVVMRKRVSRSKVLEFFGSQRGAYAAASRPSPPGELRKAP